MTTYIATLILSAIVSWFTEPAAEPQQYLYTEQLPLNKLFEYAACDKIPSDGEALLLGQFRPTDDDRTWELRKRLVIPTDDDTIRAYNFRMLNAIAEVSDAALAEVIGKELYSFILDNPDYTVNYLASHPKLEEKYVSLLGYAIACSDECRRTTAYSDSLIHAVNTTPYLSRPTKLRFLSRFLYWYHRALTS